MECKYGYVFVINRICTDTILNKKFLKFFYPVISVYGFCFFIFSIFVIEKYPKNLNIVITIIGISKPSVVQGSPLNNNNICQHWTTGTKFLEKEFSKLI